MMFNESYDEIKRIVLRRSGDLVQLESFYELIDAVLYQKSKIPPKHDKTYYSKHKIFIEKLEKDKIIELYGYGQTWKVLETSKSVKPSNSVIDGKTVL